MDTMSCNAGRSQRDTWGPRPGVMRSCEPQCEWWELSTGPQEEHPVILTSAPFLQSLKYHFSKDRQLGGVESGSVKGGGMWGLWTWSTHMCAGNTSSVHTKTVFTNVLFDLATHCQALCRVTDLRPLNPKWYTSNISLALRACWVVY